MREYSGELQVAYNADYRQRSTQMIIGEGVVVAYSESPDGMKLVASLAAVRLPQRKGIQPSTYVAPSVWGMIHAISRQAVLHLLIDSLSDDWSWLERCLGQSLHGFRGQ